MKLAVSNTIALTAGNVHMILTCLFYLAYAYMHTTHGVLSRRVVGWATIIGCQLRWQLVFTS